MINIKKLLSTPKDQFEAIDNLIKREQELLQAIHIFESILKFKDKEDIEVQTRMIKKFLSKYE